MPRQRSHCQTHFLPFERKWDETSSFFVSVRRLHLTSINKRTRRKSSQKEKDITHVPRNESEEVWVTQIKGETSERRFYAVVPCEPFVRTARATNINSSPKTCRSLTLNIILLGESGEAEKSVCVNFSTQGRGWLWLVWMWKRTGKRREVEQKHIENKKRQRKILLIFSFSDFNVVLINLRNMDFYVSSSLLKYHWKADKERSRVFLFSSWLRAKRAKSAYPECFTPGPSPPSERKLPFITIKLRADDETK